MSNWFLYPGGPWLTAGKHLLRGYKGFINEKKQYYIMRVTAEGERDKFDMFYSRVCFGIN